MFRTPKVTEIPSLRIPVEIRPAIIGTDRHPRVLVIVPTYRRSH